MKRLEYVVVTNFFSPGPGNGSKQFDNDTEIAIFAKFKAARCNQPE